MRFSEIHAFLPNLKYTSINVDFEQIEGRKGMHLKVLMYFVHFVNTFETYFI